MPRVPAFANASAIQASKPMPIMLMNGVPLTVAVSIVSTRSPQHARIALREIHRQAEVAGESVAGAGGDDAERDVGADEALRHFVNRAVAADREDGVTPRDAASAITSSRSSFDPQATIS